MPEQGIDEQELDRFLNELVGGDAGNGSTTLDLDVVETIHAVRALAATPLPRSSHQRSAFALHAEIARLDATPAKEATMTDSARSPVDVIARESNGAINGALFGDRTLPASSNGRTEWPLPARSPCGDVTRGGWLRTHLATAALVLVVLIGSVLAFGAFRLKPMNSTILPAAWLQEPTVTTPPPTAPVLAEFVREITLGTKDASSAGGVAVAADGTLYVIDSLQDHIRVFDRDGTPLATWGERGTAPGQFTFSKDGGHDWGDLALGPDGNLYVADTFNARIQVLTPDGHFLREWGELGEEDGQFDWPSGIGIDAAGRVYVTDNTRLQLFEADGHFLASWDGSAAEGGSFGDPGDVAIDAAGIVSVTDFTNGRVVRFDPDGTVIATIHSEGSQQGQFVSPWGAAVDAMGNLYVAEWAGGRVQVMAPDGTWLGRIGTSGTKPGQYLSPLFVAISPDEQLYVADERTGRVLVFRLMPAP